MSIEKIYSMLKEIRKDLRKGWITLESGTHVFIDENTGKITEGPKDLENKPINHLSDSGKTTPHEKPANKLPIGGGKPASKYGAWSPKELGEPIPTSPKKPQQVINREKELAKRLADLDGDFGDSPYTNGDIQEAIELYTKDGYVSLNKQARKCPPDFQCLTEDNKYLFSKIEAAIEAEKEFDEPVTVFRGIDLGKDINHKVDFFIEEFNKSIKSGVPLSFPSITSTSTNTKAPTELAMGGSTVMFQIKAKKGLPVDKLSSHRGEDEIILSAHAKYKVISVEDVEYGDEEFPTIYLEQVL